MRNKRLLLMVILLLGVGFATVTATLVVTGNVKIATNNADFDVIFTKAIINGTDAPSAISGDGKVITFATSDLSTVGSISRLDFEVTNNSELYDAEVSISCTASGDKSSYNKITPTPSSAFQVAGKATKLGRVDVELVKATLDEIHEEFTCTLIATAKERTSKAESTIKYTPKYFDIGKGSDLAIPTKSSTQDYTTLTYPEGVSAVDQQARVFVGLDEDGQKSVCTLYTGSPECFRGGTRVYVEEEKEHLKEVFGEANCSVNNGGYGLVCEVDNLSCIVVSMGVAQCNDDTAKFFCTMQSDGMVVCDTWGG